MQTRPITPDPNALLTEVQAADLLSLSIRTLQAWRSTNVGPPYVRAGRAVRYRRGALIDWANANTCHPKGHRHTDQQPGGVKQNNHE